MQDILIQADSQGVYDLVIDEISKDLDAAGGFETAIPLTLFTDARAEPFQHQVTARRRGWAGDVFTSSTDFSLGSQLWIFDQAKNTAENRNLIRSYARSALQWFVDSGFVADVGVGQLESTTNSATIPLLFTNLENVVTKYITLWRRTDANKLPNVE